jgi:hypothetical protein
MSKLYLANAFSISMISPLPQEGRTVKVRPVSLEEAKSLLQGGEYVSAVGHPSTAQVMSALLGVEVPPRRVSITLSPGDRVLVFQLTVRLAEGQILSQEEVAALYNEGKATFAMVEVEE